MASLWPVVWWLMVKPGISRVLFLGRIPWMVESKWLRGQQMGTWLPWPSCLYLAFCDSVASAIAHQPSFIVKGSAARYAGLPIQVPTPVSVNAVHLLPCLSPGLLPMTISHKRGQPYPGPSLQLWGDLFCHGKACPLTMGAIQAWGGGGVAPVSSVSVHVYS